VVFFGTAEFAVPALRAIAEHVSLVVSQPDRPSGRGNRLHSSPVKRAAEELGLPCETPEKSRSPEFVARLRAEDADVLVVAAYGQILSQAVLDSATRGGVNLHGSILPKYRGAAPIQRCILEGETETGVTLMQMARSMDTGDMIDIRRLDIGPHETYGQLQERLGMIGAEQLFEWLPRIVAGDYPRTPQDPAQATVAPKIEKAEAELDFRRAANEEYNRFRAMTPNPGAFIRTRFGSIRIARAMLGPDVHPAPGTVLATSPELTVAFAGGSLALEEIRPEGKKQMRGADFANGARLRSGDGLL
jgi:methionyl-tRNA formyltransferase